MFVYSTCRDCGGLLHVTDSDTVHPLCTPKPTRVEQLGADWLTAALAGDEFTADGLEYDIDQLDAREPRMLDAALRYAAWGWPVFPLKPNGKQPATRNGFKDATTDPRRIRAWWADQSGANIGLPTGIAFDVIDVDVPTGAPSYTDLIAEQDTATGRGVIPDVHGQVATASGGLHLYIPATGDGNRAGILPGIDYRGAGGYVVAPPSTLGQRGRSWSWISTPSPALTTAHEVAA